MTRRTKKELCDSKIALTFVCLFGLVYFATAVHCVERRLDKKTEKRIERLQPPAPTVKLTKVSYKSVAEYLPPISYEQLCIPPKAGKARK